MSRRSKPSGSAAPAPAVIRYLSRRPPVEVRMRIREATFSAAWARSSMVSSVLRGKVGFVAAEHRDSMRGPKVQNDTKLCQRDIVTQSLPILFGETALDFPRRT